MEPRFITPFDSVIIINLIGMLSLLKLTSFLPIEWAEPLLRSTMAVRVFVAEGLGFEPRGLLHPPVFKTGAINRTLPPLHITRRLK